MKKLLFIIALCNFTTIAMAQINLSQGLMAYYPFSGNAGDSSGNGNNGIVSNATLTSDRYGNPNSAYLFDGATSFIQVPYSSSLQTSNYELTICAWVKIRDYTGTPNKEAIILEKANGNNGDWGMLYGDTDPNPSIEKLRFNGYAFKNGGYIATGSHTATSPDTGTWYFLTMTFDATAYGNMEYFINCKLESTVGNGGNAWSFWANNSDLIIGKAYTNNKYFNGVIDDIRIYNRKLSQCEVLKLYEVSKPAAPPSQATTEGGKVNFILTPPSCNNIGYQWQVDTGSGFYNIGYGGNYIKTNDTLSITNVPKSFNGYKYRCIITGIANLSAPGQFCRLDTTGATNLMVFPTTIDDIEIGDDVIMYPNPTSGFIAIQSALPLGQIVLTDIMGRVFLKNQVQEHQISIDLSTIPRGVYLIRVENKKIEKLVLE